MLRRLAVSTLAILTAATLTAILDSPAPAPTTIISASTDLLCC